MSAYNAKGRWGPYVDLARSAYNNRDAIAARMQAVLGQVKGFRNTAKLTPGVALKKTALKSYLDKTYAKKCGVEVKQFLSADTAVAPATTLATMISPFQNIAQGLTDGTRIGNSIEIKSLNILLHFTGNATAMSRVRIIVLKQGLMTGAVPGSTDVLENSSNIRSFYALDKDVNFKILKDSTFELTPLSTNDSATFHTWRFNYKPKTCSSIRFTQSDVTGAVANMIEGNINVKIMYEGGAPSGTFTFKAEWVDS